MDKPTFVYENTEVQLTGRKAHRPKKGRLRNESDVIVLVEIMPVDKYDGTEKKWVSMDVLYTITDEN